MEFTLQKNVMYLITSGYSTMLLRKKEIGLKMTMESQTEEQRIYIDWHLIHLTRKTILQ